MMDDQNAPAWVWQGFFGPVAEAIAGKALTDVDSRAGVWVPLPGEPPMPVDVEGVMLMFAVQTRPGDPIPTPSGMLEADPSLVGRMVNA
jgi:hypothetical protein